MTKPVCTWCAKPLTDRTVSLNRLLYHDACLTQFDDWFRRNADRIHMPSLTIPLPKNYGR